MQGTSQVLSPPSANEAQRGEGWPQVVVVWGFICLFQSPGCRKQIWGHGMHGVLRRAVPAPICTYPLRSSHLVGIIAEAPPQLKQGQSHQHRGRLGLPGQGNPQGFVSIIQATQEVQGIGHQEAGSLILCIQLHQQHGQLVDTIGIPMEKVVQCGTGLFLYPYITHDVRPQVTLAPNHACSLGSSFPNELKREDHVTSLQTPNLPLHPPHALSTTTQGRPSAEEGTKVT